MSNTRPDVGLLFDGSSGANHHLRFAREMDRTRVFGVSDELWACLDPRCAACEGEGKLSLNGAYTRECDTCDGTGDDPDQEWVYDAWDGCLQDAILVGGDIDPAVLMVARDMEREGRTAKRDMVLSDAGAETYHLDQTDGDTRMIPTAMSYDERSESWFYPSPMAITIADSDDDDGLVTVYCDSQAQARLDQSIDGSRWECPRDMDVAYACITVRPGLIADLRAEGYVVDDSEYTEPTAEDGARWEAKLAIEEGR